MRKAGIRVLIFCLLCSGVVNFSLWMLGNFAIMQAHDFLEAELRAFDISDIAAILSALLLLGGFLSSLSGSIALFFNKTWGKKISILGIRMSFTFCLSLFILAFLMFRKFSDIFTVVAIANLTAFLISFIAGSIIIKKLKQV